MSDKRQRVLMKIELTNKGELGPLSPEHSPSQSRVTGHLRRAGSQAPGHSCRP